MECRFYLVMSRVALPPTFIWTTPSSHPRRLSVGFHSGRPAIGVCLKREPFTLDDLANADLGDEVAAADGAVKPWERGGRISTNCKCCYVGLVEVVLSAGDSLLALVVGLRFVLQVSSVLHGDSLSRGWLCASALLVMCYGDGHFCCWFSG